MRKLVWFCGVLAVLWSGAWVAGTYAIRQAAQQGVAQAAAQGHVIAPDVLTGGFPTAFDVTLQDLTIGNPETGLRWQTPDVQVQAALWRPWHVVALLNDEHTVLLHSDTLKLSLDDGRASMTVTPDTYLTLSQLALTLTQPALESSFGWRGAGDVAEVHVNLLAEPANSYAVALNASNIQLDPTFSAITGLDGSIAKVAMDGTASFAVPLDRFAGDQPPQITAFSLSPATLQWGDVLATATGSIAANADGLAEGRIDVTIKGWRKLIPALVATGAITPNVAPTVEGFLNAIAAQGGDPETLSVPLIYQNGLGTFGPLPLGPAPRMN
ncbi:MAG: DUF2125 domain-containing protein [Paracoccaceae bacterium]